jgi:hypothetical protein
VSSAISWRMAPISEFEPFSIIWTEPPLVFRGDGPIAARRRTPPGTLRKARSQFDPGIGRGKAGHGRAGQAFALVESGVMDRATANSLPRTAVGHKQDDQAAETKPPSGSCSRILDQSLEPTRVRFSRNRPLERASAVARLARGWAGRSPPLTPKQLASHRTPDPNVDVPRFSHSSVESGSLSFMR